MALLSKKLVKLQKCSNTSRFLVFVYIVILINCVQFMMRRSGVQKPINLNLINATIPEDISMTSNNKIETIPSSDASKLSQFHTVTYASHRGSDDRFCMALESAARHKINLIILGWGVPWRGLFQKLEAAMNLTASLPPNDVVLFVDAFDILFTNASSQVRCDGVIGTWVA